MVKKIGTVSLRNHDLQHSETSILATSPSVEIFSVQILFVLIRSISLLSRILSCSSRRGVSIAHSANFFDHGERGSPTSLRSYGYPSEMNWLERARSGPFLFRRGQGILCTLGETWRG